MKLSQAIQSVAVVTRNLLLGGNIAALTLASKPRKMVSYISESLFLYKTIGRMRGLPQKNVFKVLNGENVQSIQLGNLDSDEAWFWAIPSFTVDIISLCLICRMMKPRLVFEIGTLKGYTAYQFALNTPDEARILTLDLPTDHSVSPRLKRTVVDDEHIRVHGGTKRFCFQGTEVEKKVTCLFGDSANYDYTPYHGQVDFFFIDGAHSYDYVRSDTLNALQCCHQGSVIAWHDFGRVGVNGVSRWLKELSAQHQIYSVPGGSVAFMVVT